MQHIGRIVILVKNYDEAIRFYQDKLGFELLIDTQAPPHRYVHMRLPTQKNVGIWLLQEQTHQTHIGNQTAGHPIAVIYTNNLQKDHQTLSNRGVTFTKPPKTQHNSSFAHFVDLYGNEFVLVELHEDESA